MWLTQYGGGIHRIQQLRLPSRMWQCGTYENTLVENVSRPNAIAITHIAKANAMSNQSH